MLISISYIAFAMEMLGCVEIIQGQFSDQRQPNTHVYNGTPRFDGKKYIHAIGTCCPWQKQCAEWEGSVRCTC
jgi:hypothetical protein